MQGVTAFDLLEKSVDIPLIAIASRKNKKDVSFMVYATRKRTQNSSRTEKRPFCVQQKDIQQNLAVKVSYENA